MKSMRRGCPIFQAADVELPVKSADILYNRIKTGFSESRDAIKHQLAIFGVIGHWITPGFEKREVVIDFAEIQGAHSGENLADSLLTVVHELDIAHKGLTITGGNASNNGTRHTEWSPMRSGSEKSSRNLLALTLK